MEDKEKELDCWNYSVLKDRNGKLQQINFTFTFGFTLPEDQLRTRNNMFCRENV